MLYDPKKAEYKPPKRRMLSNRDRKTLEAAIARIENPLYWYAGGKRHKVRSGEDDLPLYCAWTAVDASGPHASSMRVRAVLDKLARKRGVNGVIQFNDTRKHHEVIALMREGLALV